ncbi:MAG: pyridoxamine 5'-phosphate oxidase family protein [Desulfotignum sp.]|nr:pyridoxamine 5'-phosphate oxidase family protein [Desulfotignum sp.]MCF8112708.1 pyridoxamine 5'-phosphate oxidase family protein [Desulfotignum sp.]MCF8126064.1 pyridoxamine 5'-phosphate oxidase family protein [Desulfotignum sp.]
MRRKEKQITKTADIEQILKQGQVCRLGFVDRNVPYIVPVNYGYQDQALYFHSAPAGRKIDLICANPLVCFEVDELVKMNKAANACDWGVSFKSVIGTGTARMLETPAEKKAGLDIIMAHYSGRSFDYPDKMLAKTAVIKVTVEEMTGKQG